MKQFVAGSVHDIGPKVCDALGIDADRTSRIIIDVDVSDPVVHIYVEQIGDEVGIDAVLSVLLPWIDLQERDEA